jgi:hypothetical protein
MRTTLHRPATSNALNELHRARFLLSGLMRCGCCGGGYTIIGKDRYGCAARKQKGTCNNGRTISRQAIEARVFDGLKDRLLAPDLVAEFMTAMQDELGALRRECKANDAKRTRKLAEIDRKISGMMRAIEDGLYEPSMKTRLKDHLIRSMIDRVELFPRAGERGLEAKLHGDLPWPPPGPDPQESPPVVRPCAGRVAPGSVATESRAPPQRSRRHRPGAPRARSAAAVLAACAGAVQKENAPDLAIAGRQLSVVAGARNCLDLLLVG